MSKNVEELSNKELAIHENWRRNKRKWAHIVGVFEAVMFWTSVGVMGKIIILACMTWIAYTVKDVPKDLKIIKEEKARRGL